MHSSALPYSSLLLFYLFNLQSRLFIFKRNPRTQFFIYSNPFVYPSHFYCPYQKSDLRANRLKMLSIPKPNQYRENCEKNISFFCSPISSSLFDLWECRDLVGQIKTFLLFFFSFRNGTLQMLMIESWIFDRKVVALQWEKTERKRNVK